MAEPHSLSSGQMCAIFPFCSQFPSTALVISNRDAEVDRFRKIEDFVSVAPSNQPLSGKGLQLRTSAVTVLSAARCGDEWLHYYS